MTPAPFTLPSSDVEEVGAGRVGHLRPQRRLLGGDEAMEGDGPCVEPARDKSRAGGLRAGRA